MTETGGDDAPARAGYVDDAIRRIRVAAAAAGRGGAPGAAGTADPEVLRTALASLSPDDQRLLWATHVERQEPSAVAAALGTHPRTAARLLPQAEQALATALADAHARGCPPGCAGTRAALLGLVHGRLPAGQEAEPEDHLLDCAGCLRAFVDVREPAWALRDAGPRLLAGGWCPPAVAATTVHGATDVEPAPRPVRRQSWLIVAGTVACVAVAAVAIALGTGDAAPAAPDPGSSPETTTVGTVPGDATSPLATPSSTPPGDGTPSGGPTPSEDATGTPSGEPSPTASTDDDAEEADPSTSSTSSPARDDEPTSSGSTSSKPTSRPSSTPTTTPTAKPTDEATTEPPTTDPSDPGPTDPADPGPTDPADPEPTEPEPTEPEPTDPAEPTE